MKKLNEEFPVLGDEIQMLAEFAIMDENEGDDAPPADSDIIGLSMKITMPISHKECPSQEEVQDALEEVLMMLLAEWLGWDVDEMQ